MADQNKHNKTTEEKDDMETTVNGALLKELFESIDVTIERTNDAKTNISSIQSDVATNNAKVGITTSQAASITSSASKVANLEMGRVVGVPTNVKNVTAQIRHSIQINAKTGVAVIARTVILSNGNTYTSSETLTAQKS